MTFLNPTSVKVRWLSGRKRRITNPENVQAFRGFESHPHCQEQCEVSLVVEQDAHNVQVTGSTPVPRTKQCSRGGMVYTTDLKSVAPRAYRFESGREYQDK